MKHSRKTVGITNLENRVGEFMRKYPESSSDGANVQEFAEFAEELRDEVVRLDLPGSHGETAPDKRKSGKGIQVRTVRYYQTRGWIASPREGESGNKVFYTGLHLAQMLTAYRLRLEGRRRERELARVALTTSVQDCFAILESSSTSDDDPGSAPRVVSQAPCKSFEIFLVPVRNDGTAHAVTEDLRELAGRLLGNSSTVRFAVSDEMIDIAGEESFRERIPAYREKFLSSVADDVHVHVFTSQAHRWNWFADWGETGVRNGAIHLEDYESAFGVSKVAIAASYSLLLAFAGELAIRGVSPYELFHRKSSRGCLFDFCEQREDVVLKLGCGDICKDCLERIRPLFEGNLLADVARLLDGIRRKVRAIETCLPDSDKIFETSPK